MSKFIDKVKFEEKINDNENHLIHVVIVEGSFNQRTLETSYTAKVQAYDVKSWETSENQLSQLGYSHVFILHDPRVKSVEKKASNLNEEGSGEGSEEDGKKDLNQVNKGDKPKEDAQEVDRVALIEEAVSLGFTGNKKQKNAVYQEFIDSAKEILSENEKK